ncbi:MAG: energy-coupling factor ABC transporter permease [Actinomycetota bacterium]
MHIQDGIINAPVSFAFGVVAFAGVAAAVSRARRELDDRAVPLAGLVAAYIFAVQLLNFQILPGVSGHLLGGTLATLLVGPWLGILCVTVTLVVQALLFADGGLSALGLSITNMGLVTSLVAAAMIAVMVRRSQPTRRALIAVAFVVSIVTVLAGASMFLLQFALGGTIDVPLQTVIQLQLGFHALIGVGEGIITAVTMASVAATRPDLVWALRRRQPAPLLPTEVLV